jgi:hypothetical protein
LPCCYPKAEIVQLTISNLAEGGGIPCVTSGNQPADPAARPGHPAGR